MKIATVLVLALALGLTAARSLDADHNSLDVGEDSLVGDEFVNEGLVDGDDDDEEIVDMDDALQKMRMLKAIGRIVDQAQADDMKNRRKRFIGSVVDAAKDKLLDVLDHFTTWLQHTDAKLGKDSD